MNPGRGRCARLGRLTSRVFAAAATGLAGLALAVAATAAPPVEYQVQAAYVSKFLLFVEWPPEAVTEDRYLVGVAGEEDFWTAMQALEGHEIEAARISTRRVDGPENVAGLHVLVVEPGQPREAVDALLAAAAGRPILTVGRAEAFAARGGVIQFVIVEDTVRFGVNLDAAESAGLAISSRLMRAARDLEDPDDDAPGSEQP